jgi:antitoxin PrlF
MSTISAKLTSKGQLTVPKMVRERLGIQPGDELEFVEEDGTFLIRKQVRESPFDRYIGFLSHARGTETDDVLTELRGEA